MQNAISVGSVATSHTHRMEITTNMFFSVGYNPETLMTPATPIDTMNITKRLGIQKRLRFLPAVRAAVIRVLLQEHVWAMPRQVRDSIAVELRDGTLHSVVRHRRICSLKYLRSTQRSKTLQLAHTASNRALAHVTDLAGRKRC